MEIRLNLNLKFNGVIDDSPIKITDMKNPTILKAKTFVREFVKNEKAVMAFFKNYLIEKYFHDYKEDFNFLEEELGYMQDFKPLFLEAASGFPGDLREEMTAFINWAYEDLPIDHKEAPIREKGRYYIETYSSSIVMTGAIFFEEKEVSNPK